MSSCGSGQRPDGLRSLPKMPFELRHLHGRLHANGARVEEAVPAGALSYQPIQALPIVPERRRLRSRALAGGSPPPVSVYRPVVNFQGFSSLRPTGSSCCMRSRRPDEQQVGQRECLLVDGWMMPRSFRRQSPVATNVRSGRKLTCRATTMTSLLWRSSSLGGRLGRPQHAQQFRRVVRLCDEGELRRDARFISPRVPRG